jgi:hypothetical protein
MRRTSSEVGAPSVKESTWSSSESPSRIPPSGLLRDGDQHLLAHLDPLAPQHGGEARHQVAGGPMRWKSKRWQRERIGGAACWIFCGSVVAKTKITRGGGSSRILRSAFHASRVSMCASSMM